MSSRFFWAILFIAAGVLLLLNNFGILSVNIWAVLWPLFIILLGLGLLLGAMRRGAPVRAVPDSLALEGATAARIVFQHAAGRLFVHAGTGADQLYSGQFGGGVQRRVNRSGPALDVTLKTSDEAWAAPWEWFGRSGGLDWDVALNPNVPLSLDFETGASHTELDLTDLCVRDLRVQTGASSTAITMPAHAGATQARIESGAASVRVRIPDSVAARISGTMGLGALNVNERRFPRRGAGYESDDYATAANRLDLRVEGGVGSVQVS